MIRMLEKYGARRAKVESHDQRLVAWRTPSAAAAPTVTSVIARPTGKNSTSAKPSVNFFNWRQSSRTVIAAGHGIRPPVSPNMMIWPGLTRTLLV